MHTMLTLFTQNLLPVFLTAACGYVLAAVVRVEVRSIAHVAFYVFAPCLVFRGVVTSRLPGADVVQMVTFSLASMLGLAVLAAVAGRLLGLSRSLRAAVVLVVLLPNAANYGLSVVHFAFGERALAHATLYFVTSSVVTFTIGVFVASLGRKKAGSALLGLLRVPAVWAVALAVLTVRSGYEPPVPVERTIDLLADACIPVFLIVLGMQLQGQGLKGPFKPVVLATTLRLAGGCGIALLLAWVMGLEGPARQAGILESAMPSAVITTVLAMEYDVEPAFVTSVVFLTTLLSPLTLTPLLSYLSS